MAIITLFKVIRQNVNGKFFSFFRGFVQNKFMELNKFHVLIFPLVSKIGFYCGSILWMTIVSTAIVVAAVLLLVSWQMNLVTPTITVIESTHYPVSNVYFPAVTICNINLISAKRAMDLAKNLTRPTNVTPNELSQMFRLILQSQKYGTPNQTEYEVLHNILQTNNLRLVNLTRILPPTCNEMIQGCQWKGERIRCDTLFQPIITSTGGCCSFNSYATAKTNFHS